MPAPPPLPVFESFRMRSRPARLRYRPASGHTVHGDIRWPEKSRLKTLAWIYHATDWPIFGAAEYQATAADKPAAMMGLRRRSFFPADRSGTIASARRLILGYTRQEAEDSPTSS